MDVVVIAETAVTAATAEVATAAKVEVTAVQTIALTTARKVAALRHPPQQLNTAPIPNTF